ncbi:MAG: hypothetical protein R3B13_08500 [Polyangiaceae bacterium]
MTQYHQQLLRDVFAGRRWILAFDVLAGCNAHVNALRSLGAESCLCIAGTRGVGPMPDPEFAPNPLVLDVTAPNMMTAIHRSLDALASLSPEHVRAVQAFDPSETARVLGTFFDDGRPVAGRRKFGARPASWQALEDKTVIDALWQAAGIAHAPVHVVAAEANALREAAAAVDEGLGTAWAGDNKEGFNGGATFLRWVRNDAHAEEATAFFAQHCDRVRVMPFLEGIPCSIHGFVFRDDVIALRPCEMVVLRKPGDSQLQYARAATFWDPPAADREAMRNVARKVGAHLRATYDYRGAFTVDGVLTERGFLPTELNPRFGAALAVMAAKCDLFLPLLNAAIIERDDLDFRPRELERELLQYADAHRAGGGMAPTDSAPADTQYLQFRLENGAFVVAGTGSEAEGFDATARFGPGASGGLVFVELSSATTPVGPSAAPRVAAALMAASDHFQLGLGPYESARDVREPLS